MAYMYNTGRDVLSFLGMCFGPIIAFMGLMLYFLVGSMADIWFQRVFLALILIGFGLLVVGLALYPGTRRRTKLYRRVLEIAAVEKEVTISDLHVRTGIDSELVRQILVHCLMNGMLFGYIDGDLFVRDTSGRPFRFRGGTGLYGV
jgi:hypothetical protein